MYVEKLRIKQLREILNSRFNDNLTRLSEAIGKKQPYTHGVLNSKRPFSEKLARTIEEKLNLPLGYLDQDESAPGIPFDIAAIPIYGLKLSAGAGCSIINEEVIDQFWVSKKTVAKHGWKPSNLCIFAVKGDSMLGRINEGQQVLVNRGEQDIIDGKIYAFCVKDEVFIKYLFRNLVTKEIIARSHNIIHRDIYYSPEDINIIGRVRMLLAVVV